MTDTLRVDICYRPLRIGWAVRHGDWDSLRKAMRYSHALCGGRFNPILVVDHEDESKRLVDIFRADLIVPVGNSPEVLAYGKKFPHLINPLQGNKVFERSDNPRWRSFANALDVVNIVSHWRLKPEWKQFVGKGIRDYQWDTNDPLRDIFLMHLGGFPDPADVGTDYVEVIKSTGDIVPFVMPMSSSIPADLFEHRHLGMLSRLGLERHYSIQADWGTPGFYVGQATDFDDVVACWNIRACDTSVWFVDRENIARYADFLPKVYEIFRKSVDRRIDEWDRRVSIWSRGDINADAHLLGDMELMRHRVTHFFWLRQAATSPMMHLGECSTLGVVGESGGAPRISFALPEKPFNGDVHFHVQRLIASVSLIGSLDKDENIFNVPYIPELNEFYGREMHLEYDGFRVEPERLGLVIRASDNDDYLKALPVIALVGALFDIAGMKASISNGGRIVKLLLTQMGGLQGARVFKIPGVRGLLKMFGPRKSFTRRVAENVIRGGSADNRAGTFKVHERLYLEPRPAGTSLTPAKAFSYMVEKGLFRIGVDLDCPKCGMTSWVAVDALKHSSKCEMCGHDYDATKQLVSSEWHFRRSGVLGAERNSQGAVPVALTLQQIDMNDRGLRSGFYTPSLDLLPKTGSEVPTCEVDFVWISRERYPERISVVIAECKDVGPINPAEFARDVKNMGCVADALSKVGLRAYVLFTKLAPFTQEEIDAALSLNDQNRNRVILLTERELEPGSIADSLEGRLDQHTYSHSVNDLANITERLYRPPAAAMAAAAESATPKAAAAPINPV